MLMKQKKNCMESYKQWHYFCFRNIFMKIIVFQCNNFLHRNLFLNSIIYFFCEKCESVRFFVTPRTLCLPGSSVHGILQARILTWDEKLYGLGWPGPKDLKGVLLAAPGWLWEGPCHRLFITPWGMPALANPAQRGQSGDSPLSTASSPPQLCGSACGSFRRTSCVVIRLYLDWGLAVQSQASVTHCWQYKRIIYLKKKKNTEVGCHSLLQGNLPDPGIESWSSALQADSCPSELPGSPLFIIFLLIPINFCLNVLLWLLILCFYLKSVFYVFLLYKNFVLGEKIIFIIKELTFWF